LNDFLKDPKELKGDLESYPNNKKKPAAEVIEEEIARVILKDRLVTKKDGKWAIETENRSFGSTQHTFGGGA
jgi:DNA-directed RNA polymerase specialized sigma54-like protein